MTYFKISLGFECGVEKSICSNGYPDYCPRCIHKRISQANCIIDNVETIERDSEEKRKEASYKLIWWNYEDILNIRHVIILSKNGIPLFNMPVGDRPFDATLLSGFIQANIAFSSKELIRNEEKKNLAMDDEKNFYEFHYKNFNILLRNSSLCSVCLILDVRASNNLRELLSSFVKNFEKSFKTNLTEFEKKGNTAVFKPVKNLIEKTLDINLIYPQTLSPQIPPTIVDNLSLIQKAIFEFSNELLKEKPYFFIPNLLHTTARILGVIPIEETLWNIYHMIKNNIIISKDLHFQRDELDIHWQKKKQRENEINKIMEKKEIKDIINECKHISFEKASKMVVLYSKKAEIANSNFAYQEALNEYEKALAYAREFEIEPEAGKISFHILELLNLNKQIELEFAKKQSSKFEKKKDYVKALKYLFDVKDLLSTNDDSVDNEKQSIKLNQRIKKLQNFLL